MAEKESPTDMPIDPAAASEEEPEAKEEEMVPSAGVEVEEEKPPIKKKAKGKEAKSKKRTKLTILQAAVLETIREYPQRPRAIQTIIHSAGGVDIPRNEIIRSLNELKNKGLVEKVSSKAWQAT